MPLKGTYIVKSDIPFEERVAAIRDAGFDFVCIGMGGCVETGWKLPDICRRAGFEIDNIHLTGEKTNFIWGPGEEGDAICDRYCREIAEASGHGLTRGIVHVTWGKKITPEPPGDVGYARYEKIGETAAKYGFTVCVENSIFPDHFFSMLGKFQGPEFAHCFDCGHWNAFMREYDVPGPLSERLQATHIHDNDGRHDLHLLPFDGCADWELIAKKLAGAAYSREKICAEFGGYRVHEYPGKSAEKLTEVFSRLAIAGTGRMKVTDGAVSFYDGVPYAELVGDLYERICRLADMVEAVK